MKISFIGSRVLAIILAAALVVPGPAAAVNVKPAGVKLGVPTVVLGDMRSNFSMGISALDPLNRVSMDPTVNLAAMNLKGLPAIAPVAALEPASIARFGQIPQVGPSVAAKAFPAGGSAQRFLSAMTKAVGSKNIAAALDHVFDASVGIMPSKGAVDAESEDGIPEEVKAKADVLYEKYEKAAAKRLADLDKEIAQIKDKSGRFGMALQRQPTGENRIRYAVTFTLEGKILAPAELKAQIASGGISQDAWDAAKSELEVAAKGVMKKLEQVLKKNSEELQAVTKEIQKLAQAWTLEKTKATKAKGQELESWGLPIQISINNPTQKMYLRYAKLYQLNGMPTDLGAALHDLMAPFVAADPAFLSKVTQAQLHDAVYLLAYNMKYFLDPKSEDGQKRMRFNMEEPYDYPEVRKSVVDAAREALTRPPLAGDQSAGLGIVAEDRRASSVLTDVLKETYAELKRKKDAGASFSEMEPIGELAVSIHAAMGVPVPAPNGQSLLVPVRHRLLIPILAELKRRQVHDDVVRTLIRSFPLGESLLRLGVHRLWEQGLTGKGIKIAMLDNGIDPAHPAFQEAKIEVENMTRDRGVHMKGPHGTPMASIIHAIAPDAEIISVQVLSNTRGLPGVALSGVETNQAIIKGLDLAVAKGAQIVSMSLGAAMSYSNDEVSKKVSELAKKGIIVVASAGNSGDELPNGYQVGSPGTSPGAIAVGAVDYHGKNAPFSSDGLVFNPDDNTVAQRPDIYAYGVNIKAAQLLPARAYGEIPSDKEVSGTSPATPHVTGAIALMLQAGKEAGAVVAKSAMLGLVRQALSAGVKMIERLPVFSDAMEAVKAFVAGGVAKK